MSGIPILLFDPEVEAEIKRLWPSRCPECDAVAYVGMNEVLCVWERCRNGSEVESAAYREVLAKDQGKGNLYHAQRAAEAMSGLDWEDEDTTPGFAIAPLLGICRICNSSLAKCTCPC